MIIPSFPVSFYLKIRLLFRKNGKRVLKVIFVNGRIRDQPHSHHRCIKRPDIFVYCSKPLTGIGFFKSADRYDITRKSFGSILIFFSRIEPYFRYLFRQLIISCDHGIPDFQHSAHYLHKGEAAVVFLN